MGAGVKNGGIENGGIAAGEDGGASRCGIVAEDRGGREPGCGTAHPPVTDALTLRPAGPEDAASMAAVQNAIHAAGLRRSPVTEAQALARYVSDPARIACTLATREGRVLGFQSLAAAGPGNPYHLPPGEGWGIIGTHIDPQAGRGGLGRALMAVSLDAARAAGLARIDAAIGADSPGALAYYRAMGFRPYDRPTEAGVIPHRLDLHGED